MNNIREIQLGKKDVLVVNGDFPEDKRAEVVNVLRAVGIKNKIVFIPYYMDVTILKR